MFASFARLECDEYLEAQVVQRGLHLARSFWNERGLLIYDVVKDPRLTLSDLADIFRISLMLGFEVEDRLLIDLEDDSNLAFVCQGLKYGYQFYTLSRGGYAIWPRE